MCMEPLLGQMHGFCRLDSHNKVCHHYHISASNMWAIVKENKMGELSLWIIQVPLFSGYLINRFH